VYRHTKQELEQALFGTLRPVARKQSTILLLSAVGSESLVTGIIERLLTSTTTGVKHDMAIVTVNTTTEDMVEYVIHGQRPMTPTMTWIEVIVVVAVVTVVTSTSTTNVDFRHRVVTVDGPVSRGTGHPHRTVTRGVVLGALRMVIPVVRPHVEDAVKEIEGRQIEVVDGLRRVEVVVEEVVDNRRDDTETVMEDDTDATLLRVLTLP